MGSLSEAANSFNQPKNIRGRKKGSRATSKSEDKEIKKKFLQLRPPGHGIDSRQLHKALPKKIKKKVGRKTLIRRLGEKGYTAQMKLKKNDFSTLFPLSLTWAMQSNYFCVG